MKKLSLILVLILSKGLQSYILDGTITPTIIRHRYDFVNGDQVTGDVSFEQGFNVPAGASISFNSIGSINGPILLNETGVLLYLNPLYLGPKATGFPQGGILVGSPFAAASLNFHQNSINLSSDISIGGPLQFINTQYALFNLGGNTLTLLNDGDSRGSIMSKYTTGSYTGYRNLTFNGGTLVGLEDFETGYGPRIRTSGGFFEPEVNMENVTLVLAPDSTMTVTGYILIAASGLCRFQTPTTATVDVSANNFLIRATTFSLEAGITLNSSMILWLDNSGSIISLNNATIKTDVVNQLGGDGGLHVYGVSHAVRNGGNGQWVFANSDSLDIAGGSKLICDNGVRLGT